MTGEPVSPRPGGPPAGGDVAIEVRGVGRTYPGVNALTDVSLHLERGEVLGLVGHNGAGKSTLTRILGGLERPDRGELRVAGELRTFHKPDDAIEAGICVVPQHLSIVPILTVRENIKLGVHEHAISLRGRGTRADHGRDLGRRVRAVAEQLGLEDLLDVKARDARPSTQRLVMIARALLRDPEVILLDEPTASLHPSEVERVFAVIESLREKGMAIVFISHRLEEVLGFTSRVVVLRQGRVVAHRDSAELGKAELGELIAGRAMAAPAASASVTRAEVLLEVRDLVRVPRVRGVSFDVRRGEIVGLAGLNGSGRSSVLRMIAGLDSPDEGEILVDHAPITPSRRAAIRAGVAYLPEDRVRNGVIPDMTVAATVTLSDDRRFRVHPRVPLLRRRREVAEVERLLAGLDLHPRGAARLKMKHLSGGNQQKALMARALVAGAHFFIFDEPTEGVDVGAREDLYRRIRQLAADGAGVLFASSEPEEFVALADRVIVMYDGTVTAELEHDQISEAAVTRAALVG